MNDPDLVNQCSIDENEGPKPKCSELSVSSVDGETSSEGQQTSDEQSSDLEKSYTCKRPECENLIFTTESEWHRHLVEHIGLPTINVRRLSESEQKKLLKKRQRSGKKAGPHSRTKSSSRKPKTEPLTPLRVKKVPTDSDKRVFEVVKPTKILYGPGGIYCSNGLFDVKEEVDDKGVSSGETANFPDGGSSRRVELDAQRNEEDGVEDGVVEEDRQDEESEGTQEDGEGGCSEEVDGAGNEETGESTSWDEKKGDGAATRSAPSRATSPTPSEVLRPTGLLAPEQFGDDDSCYPNSPPESESSGSRMVELNGGSGAGVGGSDNDSGHSRSPATFPGTGGGSEEDSSQPNFNWDDIVGGSTENTSVNADNDSENADSGAGDLVQTNDLDSDSGATTSLDTEPLLLNDGTENQTSTPTISVRDLQEFRNPTFSSSDAGQGDTEYMSLERLGESQVCCEVCGERAPSRQSLEEHRAVAGHYKCTTAECASILGSAADLVTHQTSVHGGQPPAQPSPPTSAGPGTPPVQQLAQQVQRLPIPQQQAQPVMVPPYPGLVPPPLAPASYPMVPQSLSPQQHQQLGIVPVPPSLSPQQQAIAPQTAQQFRRGPTYRAPLPGQPFGPGSPNQGTPQAAGNQGFPSGSGPYPGQIQPRPLNTLVAPQQPIQRAPMQVRMAAPGVMLSQRGMAPAVRAQKRLAPVPQSVGRGGPAPSKQRRVDVIPVAEVPAPGKKSDAKAVANILATRGITVTPAGVTRPGLTVQQVTGAQPGRARGQPLQPVQAQAPQPVTTLNLNSAISITPTGANNGRQQNSGFVVPHGRSVRSQPQTTNVERPPRPPTVDLTGDGPTPPAGSTRLQMAPMVHRGRGRPSLQQRTTCQICDKAFTSPEQLAQHMMVHRNPGKLPFRCNLCNAQYPTQQGLTQHRQTYHKESAGVGMGPALVQGEEMVIPLVDLKQPGVAQRLGALGIHHCIPLSGLGNQSNGFFHLPVVSIDGSRTAAASNLRSLGASGVLSIGPIKLVPRVNQ